MRLRWGKAKAQAGLVKPNLDGPQLPPEQRSQLDCAASRDPLADRQHDGQPTSQHEAPPQAGYPAVFPAAATAPPSQLGAPSGDCAPASTGEQRSSSALAQSLKRSSFDNQDAHREIHSLAERYRDKSRQIAARRELHRAASGGQRAEIVLDHQLRDIQDI